MSSSDSEEISWISWFCNLRGNEFFCEIDEEYIQDEQKLVGLSEQFRHYRPALNMILDLESEDDIEDKPADLQDAIEESAEKLYGMIHARYILSNRGMAKMIDKWQNYDFGFCSRVYCNNYPMLPIGLSDTPGKQSVKVYCANCDEVYVPVDTRHHYTDGCYFDTGFPNMLFTFPNMLFTVHPDMRPAKAQKKKNYVPKLYTEKPEEEKDEEEKPEDKKDEAEESEDKDENFGHAILAVLSCGLYKVPETDKQTK